MVEGESGIVYMKYMPDGVVGMGFDSKVGYVIGTGGLVAETFDDVPDIFLRNFYFFIGAGCDGDFCSLHSQFYLRLWIYCACELVVERVC